MLQACTLLYIHYSVFTIQISESYFFDRFSPQLFSNEISFYNCNLHFQEGENFTVAQKEVVAEKAAESQGSAQRVQIPAPSQVAEIQASARSGVAGLRHLQGWKFMSFSHCQELCQKQAGS